ncbi:MAG: TolB family protein [Chitinophagaceae bacterium]
MMNLTLSFLMISASMRPFSSTVPSHPPTRLKSILQTVQIHDGQIKTIYQVMDKIEAPNWSKDGAYLIFNRGGRIYHLPFKTGVPVLVPSGDEKNINNDHGLSPDGRWMAISNTDQVGSAQGSRIYILPVNGGIPKRMTPLYPSYWHGWSPDGKTIAYCAERNGNFDVYSLLLKGGQEKRLTTAKGLDDGPDYSPDGKFIYFNSFRTGRMQIWRMRPDGSHKEQITNDRYANWFAHPSPDGKWIVFISYVKDQGQDHPANKDVMIRLMSLKDHHIRTLVHLFGGQGTMNVPSWSPDSRQIAFVRYQLLP